MTIKLEAGLGGTIRTITRVEMLIEEGIKQRKEREVEVSPTKPLCFVHANNNKIKQNSTLGKPNNGPNTNNTSKTMHIY